MNTPECQEKNSPPAEVPKIDPRSVAPITAADLINFYQQTAEKKGEITKKTIGNVIYRFRSILQDLDASHSEDCKWLLTGRSCLPVIWKLTKGLNKRAAYDIKSAVLQMQKAFILRKADLKADAQRNIFEAYLVANYRYNQTHEIQKKQMGVVEFVKAAFNATGMPRKRLHAPIIGVASKTWFRIKDLEQSLAAPGALTKFLYRKGDDSVQYRTEYGDKASQLKQGKNHYAFKFQNWPEPLKEEWKAFFLLKTQPEKASLLWNKLFKTDDMQTWRLTSDKGCPSGTTILRGLETFFGWCKLGKIIDEHGQIDHRRSGPGLIDTELSLALFAIPTIMDDYLDFRRLRGTQDKTRKGEGDWNHSCSLTIELATTLLSPRTGLIAIRDDWYFQPNQPPSARNIAHTVGTEFLDDFTNEVLEVTSPRKRWLLHCKNRRDRLDGLRDRLDKTKVQTRKTDGSVQEILKLRNPSQVLPELRQALARVPISPSLEVHQFRDRILIEIITRIPLRITHFGFMRPRHLVKMPDRKGDYYQVNFEKGEFKNTRFLRQTGFEANLPAGLTPLIDRYLNELWPKGHGRPIGPNDRIMLAEPLSERAIERQMELNEAVTGNKDQEAAITILTTKTCQQKIRDITKRLLSEKYHTPGFGPHAFRHIIATTIIRIYGNYNKAAALLWDAVATVLRNYSHVSKNEELADAFVLMEEVSSAKVIK